MSEAQIRRPGRGARAARAIEGRRSKPHERGADPEARSRTRAARAIEGRRSKPHERGARRRSSAAHAPLKGAPAPWSKSPHREAFDAPDHHCQPAHRSSAVRQLRPSGTKDVGPSRHPAPASRGRRARVRRAAGPSSHRHPRRRRDGALPRRRGTTRRRRDHRRPRGDRAPAPRGHDRRRHRSRGRGLEHPGIPDAAGERGAARDGARVRVRAQHDAGLSVSVSGRPGRSGCSPHEEVEGPTAAAVRPRHDYT